MNIEIASKLQKKGVLIHHYVFLLFVIQRVALQFIYMKLPWKNTFIMVSFVLVCAFIERFMAKHGSFNNIIILRTVRFLQCLFCSVMIIYTDINIYSGTSIYALLMMFVVDLVLTLDFTNKLSIMICAVLLESLVFIMIFIKLSIYHDNEWLTMLFSAIILGLVLIGPALIISEYVIFANKELYKERRKFEQIVEKNENILNIQDKLKDTNNQLNLQKVELQLANKHIKEANDEMKVQEEIMRYIASSFDVPDISERIVDSIMDVKKPVFCAVYIRKNVYHNKHHHYVVKSKNSNMDEIIKEHMEDIYYSLIGSESFEKTYHQNINIEMPYLSTFFINSVYIKVLGDDNDRYGLFMIGDNRDNLFDDNMSFYNAITAQSDIAISNAKMYNDMQHMARTDGLTGINNRVYFNQLFRDTTSRIVDKKGCISVALFDIDKFKNVNDTYGHLAGDEVIKRVATVTDDYIEQHNGFICRYGGEEFVAVLPDRDINASEPIIRGLFEKLCEQIVTYNEQDIHLSVSVGLTSYPERCDDPEQLLKRADWCMYYAKEHGRHQLKLDDESVNKNN